MRTLVSEPEKVSSSGPHQFKVLARDENGAVLLDKTITTSSSSFTVDAPQAAHVRIEPISSLTILWAPEHQRYVPVPEYGGLDAGGKGASYSLDRASLGADLAAHQEKYLAGSAASLG